MTIDRPIALPLAHARGVITKTRASYNTSVYRCNAVRDNCTLSTMADLEQYGVAHCQCSIEKLNFSLKQSENVIGPDTFESEAGFSKRKLSGKTLPLS